MQTNKNFAINMDDWNTVTVIGNRRGGASGNISKERQLNIARRQGAQVTTDSKYGAGGNRQGGTSLNTAKLDSETEELKHKTVDLSVGKLIAQGDFLTILVSKQQSLSFQGDRPRRCLRKISQPRFVRSPRSSLNTNKEKLSLTNRFSLKWNELWA